MSEKTFEVTDANFSSEVLEANQMVLVDFWATWCAPCKAIAPVVEALAVNFEGNLRVGKMNVDEHPATSGQCGVRALPTFILFKNGQAVDQVVGAVPKSKLEEMVNKHL